MQISAQKRILEDVMPLRIIREVEKWPVIYKKDSPDMINPHFKFKVWEEIAKSLFGNYHIYSAVEKQARVTGLMKKWRNLRDTFKRHLKVQKKNRDGENIRKKEYVYFKHMAFLLPHMAEVEPPGPKRRALPRTRLLDATSPSCSIQSIEHIDEDRHFLLSLLPSFKRMNEDEKLTAKMEILKVIKDVKNHSMGLETFVADDTLALADAHSGDDLVLVKKEHDALMTEVSDFKSRSDSGSDDTE